MRLLNYNQSLGASLCSIFRSVPHILAYPLKPLEHGLIVVLQQEAMWADRKNQQDHFRGDFFELDRNYLLYNLTQAQGQSSSTENLYMGTDWELDGEGQLEVRVRALKMDYDSMHVLQEAQARLNKVKKVIWARHFSHSRQAEVCKYNCSVFNFQDLQPCRQVFHCM